MQKQLYTGFMINPPIVIHICEYYDLKFTIFTVGRGYESQLVVKKKIINFAK